MRMVCCDFHKNFLINELAVTGNIWTCRTILPTKHLLVIKKLRLEHSKTRDTFHERAPLTFRTSFSWWKIYSNKACKSQKWRTLKYNVHFKNNIFIYILETMTCVLSWQPSQAKSNTFKAKDENYFQNDMYWLTFQNK